MVTNAQVLVVFGLVLEFVSVFLTAYQAFYPWGYKKRKKKRIDEMVGMPYEIDKRKKRKGLLTIILLSIGMFLQGLAVFA